MFLHYKNLSCFVLLNNRIERFPLQVRMSFELKNAGEITRQGVAEKILLL